MEVKHENIESSISILRNNKEILDKKNIAQTYKKIGDTVSSSVFFAQEKNKILLGDDTAALPQEDGSHLLLASEGIISSFLNNDPWFAGYSAVMVNISDICAMGGLPVAVTDTLYVNDCNDSELIWQGMLAASQAYGVPIVGGHTCYHSQNKALSVSILGKATEYLLTSFDAQPNQAILLAINQNGNYYKEYPFWDASTSSSANELQKIARIPYEIANNKWSKVAKDVSMGGIIGTLIMLMNTSGVGAEINLEKITKQQSIPWEKWLSSFPSYGYIFSCEIENIANIQELFKANGINCDFIGKIIPERELLINYENKQFKF